jgi:hypothetical protein
MSKPRQLSPDEQYIARQLEDLDLHRDYLAQADYAIGCYLASHPELQPIWERFIASGGVNRDDWIAAILHPQRQRPVAQRREGMLRLVRSTPQSLSSSAPGMVTMQRSLPLIFFG